MCRSRTLLLFLLALATLLMSPSSTRSRSLKRTAPLHIDAAAGEGACSPDGWCWQWPTPCGEDLRALWGAAPDDIRAVGDGGRILHWDGSGWSPVSSGTRVDLRAVWGADSEHVWAVGEGALLRWDGDSWSAEQGVVPGFLLAVHGRAADDVWAAGRRGTLLHYDGHGWSRIETGVTTHFGAVAAAPDGTVWLGGEGRVEGANVGRLCRLVDGVCKDHEMPPQVDGGAGRITDLRFGPDGRLWAAQGGVPNLAVLGPDGTWERWSLPLSSYLGGLDIAADGTPWAVAYRGIMRHGADGWTAPDAPSGLAAHAILASGPCAGEPSACLVWTAGDDGTLVSWDGELWRRAGMQEGPGVLTLYRDPGGALWAGGLDGQFRRAEGDRWTPWGLGNHSIGAMWGASGDDLWATGHATWDAMSDGQSALLRFDGSRFAPPELFDAWEITGIWGATAKDVWLVAREDRFMGDGPAHLVRRYDGKRWRDVALPGELASERLAGVWGSSASDVWLLSAGRALRFDGKSWSWLDTPRPDPLRGAWGTGRDDVWLLGERHLFHWNGAEVAQHRLPVSGDARLNAIHGSAADDVWIAGDRGLALSWNGTAWAVSDTGTRTDLTAVLAEPDRTWLGTEDGGLLARPRR